MNFLKQNEDGKTTKPAMEYYVKEKEKLTRDEDHEETQEYPHHKIINYNL